jgi:HEPN domain-containing protein
MSNQDMFEEWEAYALDDEKVAEMILREDGPANPLCFHSQQMAEKYLKAYLLRKGGRFEKKHQLVYLLDLCTEIDASFSELIDDAALLSAFYIETRYPGDIPEFSLEECQKGFEAAKRIKSFILQRLS